MIKNRKKLITDKLFRMLFLSATLLSASVIVLIILFIAIKGIQPFLPHYEYGQVSFLSFLFGTAWRQDQQLYGVGFIIINTLLTSFGALLLSFPLSVLTALFIAKIAPPKLANFMRSVIELLAGIPSIVYGVFASSVITSIVMQIAQSFGIVTAGGNTFLTVILLLAIMIFPTMTSLSITAIQAVERDVELGSLALGATKTQTHFKVVLSSAKSGIFAGAILGLGRAFGEATAVAMVAGNKTFGPTWDLFDITRTLTSTMLTGLKETTGADYDIRFSVGMILIIVIFLSNGILHMVKRKIGKVQ